jgi:hypothetical protein
MSYKVRQHIPAYVDGYEPAEALVEDLNGLLRLPWVRRWEEGFHMHSGGVLPFVGWRRSGEGDRRETLMALYGADEEKWWVVAFAPAELLAELPKWTISPKGQANVDRWNRGDLS